MKKETDRPRHTKPSVMAALALAFLAAACGPPPVDVDAGPEPSDDDAGAPDANRFVHAARATGPRLMLEVAFVDDDTASVSVVGQELGTVFGLAFHVASDDGIAFPTRDNVALSTSLTEDGGRTLVRVDGNDVAFVAASTAPDEGHALTDATELVRFDVTRVDAGSFNFQIRDAMVRLTSGALLAPRTEAGVLTFTGVTP